jgi:hypothetical protein
VSNVAIRRRRDQWRYVDRSDGHKQKSRHEMTGNRLGTEDRRVAGLVSPPSRNGVDSPLRCVATRGVVNRRTIASNSVRRVSTPNG